jgi:hypothetical protein
MGTGMAVSKQLDIYLRLERLMMELDDRDDPMADKIRDLMDPVWYALSDEDRRFLDSRGMIDVQVLYPVTLAVPDLFRTTEEKQDGSVEIRPKNGIGKRFKLKEAISWAA